MNPTTVHFGFEKGGRTVKEKVRIVHFINQFFGQIGSEQCAGMSMEIKEGPVGPGLVIQKIFGDGGEVTHTVICGDNWFAEDLEDSTKKVVNAIAGLRPDVLFAGPAFNAGRYGVACGSLCKEASERLRIPVVTGMYRENPGVEIYKRYVFIINTANSARGMADALGKMVGLAKKMLNNEEIMGPEEEGYLKRGIIRPVTYKENSAARLINMALDRYNGRPYTTEISMRDDSEINFAAPLKELRNATIAVVTDGGLYPKGNPDKMPSMNTDRFEVYAYESGLIKGDWMVNHPGYDGTFVVDDPNRLIPYDALRELEEAGYYGKLHDKFLSTTGLVGSEENSRRCGRKMVSYLKDHNIDAVLLTST